MICINGMDGNGNINEKGVMKWRRGIKIIDRGV